MNPAGTSASSRLGDIAGNANVISDPTQLADYAICRKTPRAVVRPGSAAEVAEIVKFAAAEKLAIVACGARTKLEMGFVPSRYDLALDMTRMDRVIAYDPGDLTLSVEAGVRLHSLRQTLAEHRQFLPLAVPYLAQTTIGGLVASGVDAPLRQFYGTARDFLLGMEFVTGEGAAAKSGGRVVKNVTGYDIHKLMIGSLGTLGLITRVNFKTFPLPIRSRGFVARFATAERAFDMRNRVARSLLTPLTTEILSPRVAELFESEVASRYESAPMPGGVISHAGWAATIGYAGTEEVLRRYAEDLQRMAEEAGATGVAVLAENLRPAFNRKREFIPIALESSPAASIVKISVLPARMLQALDHAVRAAESNSLAWAAMARGVGVIYFALLPAERDEVTEVRTATATDAIGVACAELGGHSTIPSCPAEWKSKLKVWGLPRADFAQMQKLKRVFDPQGVLSPGRFVGGI
ncbi:MAG: FAD-binding oxidoreductase [Candidatus Acidiferrales bacterium]